MSNKAPVDPTFDDLTDGEVEQIMEKVNAEFIKNGVPDDQELMAEIYALNPVISKAEAVFQHREPDDVM